MVSCRFGARWCFGILFRVPLSNNRFHFRESNRNPNHQRDPNQQVTISGNLGALEDHAWNARSNQGLRGKPNQGRRSGHSVGVTQNGLLGWEWRWRWWWGKGLWWWGWWWRGGGGGGYAPDVAADGADTAAATATLTLPSRWQYMTGDDWYRCRNWLFILPSETCVMIWKHCKINDLCKINTPTNKKAKKYGKS